MIKRFVIAVLLLAVVGGGFVGFNLFRDRAIKDFFANRPRPTVTVSTFTVKPVTWQPAIRAIGTVRATRGVDIAVEAAGVVEDIAFKANDRVEKNQPLVRLKDEVEQADLAAARAEAQVARQNLDRVLELRERGVGAEVSADTATAEAAVAESRVARLQALLEQKELKAPFSGTIGIPRIDIGRYVTPGTMVATLQALDKMQVDFTTPEQNLPKLSIGQKVRAGPDAGDLRHQGTIAGIDPKIDPSTRLVSVRAEIGNVERRLTPGQFVQVDIERPDEDGVLAVPQTALVTSLYGDYVYVVDEAADATPAEDAPAEPKLVVRQVFVNAGRRSADMVEIVDGIEAGARVVSAGQNRLSGGTPVKIADDGAIGDGRGMAVSQSGGRQ
ncbi:MAG: efflux RND transporter periplasmic adaptor subunit [Hyphomicrobiales bacterium]|nr:efflux RND transporter periplasmic adaptor subunit [Hyphomicrobiales bacterium]